MRGRMKPFWGKQIAGPVYWLPRVVLWGGCAFFHVWKRSVMIPLPEWLVEELALWGIDAIGD